MSETNEMTSTSTTTINCADERKKKETKIMSNVTKLYKNLRAGTPGAEEAITRAAAAAYERGWKLLPRTASRHKALRAFQKSQRLGGDYQELPLVIAILQRCEIDIESADMDSKAFWPESDAQFVGKVRDLQQRVADVTFERLNLVLELFCAERSKRAEEC